MGFAKTVKMDKLTLFNKIKPLADSGKIRGKIDFDKNLARYTSWRVGGYGDVVFWPKDLQDLQSFLKNIAEDIPITFLGLGSNVLIRDGGIRGIVIITQGVMGNLKLVDNHYIYAEAGVPCAKVAKFMASNSYSKGEFLSGIPGTVGGALAMNAGAYKGETWNFVKKALMITRNGELIERAPNEFEIAYRSVKYKNQNKEWFAAAWFEFEKGAKEDSTSAIKALLKSRNNSQPIGKFSGGSVFRNPNNDYAARIIESLGLKNYTIGGAHISEKHANFIINNKVATAKDIESLIFYIKDNVQKECNIELIPEVHILGEE